MKIKIVLPALLSIREWPVTAENLPGLLVWNKVGQGSSQWQSLSEKPAANEMCGKERSGPVISHPFSFSNV